MSESKDNHYVASSKVHGKGLFAKSKIKKGDHIGYFENKPAKRDGTYVLWLFDEVDGSEEAFRIVNDMRYVNHSHKPNADLDDFDLYALKTIKPDDEILMDYGWEEE